jgi:hypothetical protein
MIVICALAPLVVAAFLAVGLSVFDLLTGGILVHTLGPLLGWTGMRWGLYMLIGVVPGIVIAAYTVLIGMAHLGDDL